MSRRFEVPTQRIIGATAALLIGAIGCSQTPRLTPEEAKARGDALLRTMSTNMAAVQTFAFTADERGERTGRDGKTGATSTTRRVVVTQPVYTTTYSTVSAYGYDTERIARGWGRRDGFKDGWKAALKNREYNVEDNGDFRDANNGYKSRFGSRFLYKTAYREGYARGYDSGFRSVAGNERYGLLKY